MKHTTPARISRANVPLAIAALAAVMLWAIAQSARAITPFGTEVQVKQIFCDLATVRGTFTFTGATYRASGTCVQLESPQRGGKGISEFPRVNESKEIFRAAWTAQGSYDPVTKETLETVTMPAPTIDQKTPVGRPYGSYETRMICATDPWLTGLGVKCTGRTVKATGNLGDMETLLGQMNQPLTTPSKQPLLQALNASHERYLSMHTVTSTARGGAAAAIFAPTIIEPTPGSMHRPQTAMSIRVAAARNAKDTHYILEIQQTSTPQNVGQANAEWHKLTDIPVTAAVAQSGLGYRGWGAHVDGTGPQMTASLGTYRVRALATAPRRSEPGEWVEFKIDGQPGVTKDDLARSKPGATDGARSAFGIGPKAAATEAPRTQVHGTPLGPGSAPVARPAASQWATQAPAPLAPAANKANAFSLNPQPPPVNPPTVLPTQAPSALR
jgi:hypothetical protein